MKSKILILLLIGILLAAGCSADERLEDDLYTSDISSHDVAPADNGTSNIGSPDLYFEHAYIGTLHVSDALVGAGAAAAGLDAHQTVTNAATGFPNRADSTLSFVAGTRTFTITPTGASFDYYIAGTRYIISAADNLVIADTSGVHWIYYDGATLSESVNPNHTTVEDLIENKALVAIIYWNTTGAGVAPLIADERHGAVMSGKTHLWLHETVGATYHSGLTLSGYTEDTDSDAALTFELTDGGYFDEDLEHAIIDGDPATQYLQQLNGGDASIPIVYKDASGAWVEDAASTLPYKLISAGNRLAYNRDNGDTTWSQVEVGDGKWVSMTLIATNDWQYPIKAIQGQNEYTDKKTAVEQATAEIISFGGGDLSPEVLTLYRFVLRTKDTFGGTTKTKIEVDGVTDFRTSSPLGVSAVATDHGSLGGLGDDDHSQYILGDLLDAKGDLITASSDNTAVILAVGADGQVLAADSTQVEGLSWIPPPSTISQANKSIYVDKEATGTDNGSDWTNAFTTIQDAVDSMEDVIIHAYTIYVRDGTKKTGTADANVLNKLHDTGEFTVATTWVGRRVFNSTDNRWGVVSARDSDDQLSIVDTAGAAYDIAPDGNENYVIEPTPYREIVWVSSNPTVNPAKLVLGNVTIVAEVYFNATCDANAVAGAIVDATYDFSAVEVGDRVWVLDLNGANGRAQDYEWGTVDDVTNAATGTLGTTLAKTPTTLWRYGIVKTENSASDDGTEAGTARNYNFYVKMDNVYIYGFYMTFADTRTVDFIGCNSGRVYYCAVEDGDGGLRIVSNSTGNCYYNFIWVDNFPLIAEQSSFANFNYNVLYAKTSSERAISVERLSYAKPQYNYLGCAAGGADGEALYCTGNSVIESVRNHITNEFLNGAYARLNAAITLYQTTNNATNPVDPVGTSEGAYIN